MIDWLKQWLGERSQAPVPVVIYSRPDCPLCDRMKAILARTKVAPPFQLHEVNIEDDPELMGRFEFSIPVLEVAGRIAFKGKLDAESFQRKYKRLLKEDSNRIPGS